MQKKILLITLLIMLFSGLSGCSCSKPPAEKTEFEPGLYLVGNVEKVGFEGESLKASFKENEAPELSVKLRGDSPNSVTVTYRILPSDSRSKALAVVGSGDDADVGVTPADNVLIFDAATDELTISLPIRDDNLYELNEVFFVELSAPSGADIVERRVEVTIENDDAPPAASINLLTELADYSALPETTDQQIEMQISLDSVSGVDASLNIKTSAGSSGSVAANRIDYILYQDGSILPDNANIIIAKGQQVASISLVIVDDGAKENQEAFSLELKVDDHVSLSEESLLAFSIIDNDSRANGDIARIALNDTGVLDLPGVSLSDALIAHVDMSLGRDSVIDVIKIGGGLAAFDYSKVSGSGEVMPDDTGFYTLDSGVEAPLWDCVRDNTTGLLWEVKVADNNHARGSSRTYFWYDPDFSANGGEAGTKGELLCDAQGQGESTLACNTAYYVADMNNAKLCGMTGWRLPTIEELRSIADYGVTAGSGVGGATGQQSVNYDTDYFAGDKAAASFVWSSTTVASNPSRAWMIRFRFDGFTTGEEARLKTENALHGIRLVNDSLINRTQ